MMKKGRRIIADMSLNALNALKELSKDPQYEVKYTIYELEYIVYPIDFINGAWCLKKMSAGFPLSAGITDIDGHCRYYGNSFFLEFKKQLSSLKNVQLASTFEIAREENKTFYYVFGQSCKPEYYFTISPEHPYGSDLMRTKLNSFRGVMGDWFIQHPPSIKEKIQWYEDLHAANNLIKRLNFQHWMLSRRG